MPALPSKRLFFALWPDAAVARRLAAVAQRAHAVCGGRPLRREDLHLTLAFLGTVPGEQLAAVRAVAAGIECGSFRLELDRLACKRRQGMVWTACATKPAPLADLVDALQHGLRSIGCALEERRFAPHVTLLRKAQAVAALPSLQPVAWSVLDFALAESQLAASGATYTLIERWRLQPEPPSAAE